MLKGRWQPFWLDWSWELGRFFALDYARYTLSIFRWPGAEMKLRAKLVYTIQHIQETGRTSIVTGFPLYLYSFCLVANSRSFCVSKNLCMETAVSLTQMTRVTMATMRQKTSTTSIAPSRHCLLLNLWTWLFALLFISSRDRRHRK